VAKSRRTPDDDDEDDAPRRRGRPDDDEDDVDEGPMRPRKKRKSAAGPTRLVFRIIGGVIGGIGIIVLLYWVYSPVGTDSSLLCYFPKETSRLQGFDVDEVVHNARARPVYDTLVNNYKLFGDKRWSQDAGVKESDVLKYLNGHANGDPDEEKDLAPQDKRGDLTVIRFKNDVDESTFVGSFKGVYLCEEQKANDGKTYYQLWWKRRVPPDWHEEREDDISFFFPNKKTLVYGTTRRELKEAMIRTPGKIAVEGTLRNLANEVDGHYFTCSAGPSYEYNGIANSMAFGLGFTDEEFRDSRKTNGVVGTASWWADNGNDFLYASANLYGDSRTASDVRQKLAAAYRKAQADIYQSESGKPGGLTDPFNPAQPKAGPGATGNQMAGGGVAASSEQTKDIIDGLAQYSATARVRQRGKLVIVEGRIEHGTPEQGVFEKFWTAVGPKFQINQGGFGGPMMGAPGMGAPGGGMPGMPGGPMPGAPVAPGGFR
jgi:hypothetical protein